MHIVNVLLAKVDLALILRSRITRAEKRAKEAKKAKEEAAKALEEARVARATGKSANITSIPFARRFGLPVRPSGIALISSASSLEALPDFLAATPHCRLEFIVLPDDTKQQQKFVNIPDAMNRFRAVPLGKLRDLKNHPTLECVLHADSFSSDFFDNLICDIQGLNLESLYIAGLPDVIENVPCLPYYHSTWQKQLDALSARLDPVSRYILAARIKALCTGNPEYYGLSPYRKFKHPLAPIGQNDFILTSTAEDSLNTVLRAAEPALRGSKANLAIDVSAQSTDIFIATDFIAGLDQDYKLFLGHHSLTDLGTVLYASLRPGV